MEKSTKYLIGGLALAAVGTIVYSRAESLTVIKDGIKRPNEGGYIRSKVFGLLSVPIGLGIFSIGLYKTLKK